MIRHKLAVAWYAGLGPYTMKENIILAIKGCFMGAADIVPGVSGGTIAFITGIYEELLAAVQSVSPKFFSKLLRLDIIGAIHLAHLRFLLPLLIGLIFAVLGMSQIIHFLLHTYPMQVWAFFFGLIVASSIVIGQKIKKYALQEILCFLLGLYGSWILVGNIALTTTPTNLSFIFLCGALAVCAMILPGISGAYILVLLGKYEYMTEILHTPFHSAHLLIIGTFILGGCCGLLSFSRILHYFLSRHHSLSISLLTGVMLGALRKIWPWKHSLTQYNTHFLHDLNFLPQKIDNEFWIIIFFMLIGFTLVLFLEWQSHKKLKKPVS